MSVSGAAKRGSPGTIMNMTRFEKRRVGSTALEVTTLGFGGATLVGMMGADVPPEQAVATVSAARNI